MSLDRALPDDPAVVEHGDVVGDLARAGHVVGDRERGGAQLRDAATISSLMTSAMIGSRPVVGSSKNMISGSCAMARARPTRFCMPPDSSAGIRLGDLGRQADLRQLLRSALRLRLARGRCRLAGEQAEGDVLPDRQAVEQRAALEQHAELAAQLVHGGRATAPTTSSPSIWIEPLSASAGRGCT